MDRPRPKTPEPSSSSVFAPQNGTSSRLLAPRPSAPAVLPAFAAAPIFPGPPSSASKTSVLDRPRPKTPEVFQRLDSSPSSAKTATSPRDSVSRQSDGRTTTPTPIFPSKPRTSVLDRPRPRTPRSAAPTEESVHMSESPVSAPVTNDVVRTESRNREPSSPLLSPSLDGDSASRQTVADDEKSIRDPDPVLPKPSVLDRPRPKTPDAASWLHGAGHKGPAATGHHARPNYSIATSGTAFSSSKSGSLDSIGPVSGSSSVSVTSPASTVSSFRPSVESASHPHQQQQQAAEPASPLLKLDFDFGSTFSSAETMFGLSDYLQLGGDATPKHRSVTPTAPPPLKSEDIERGSIAEDVAEPIHAPERGPSRTKEPEPSTPTRSSSTPHVPAETLARTPLATSSGDPSSPRSVLAVAGAPATDEAGSFETRRTSNASAIADEQVKTSPLFSGSDASPDRPKRKRRKSLASLLSFRSTNHSVDDTHGPPDSTDGAAHRRYTPQEEGSRETGPYSSHATSEREFGSLPQPNRHAPEPILGPVVARQRSYNLDASPDNPRKRGPGAAFQVISATSSRQPSRNASGSVSSLHTSETDSSDLHSRPSLDFYRLSSRGKSDIYPEKTDSRHQRAPSATLPLGRRLVEKFTRGAATRPTPEGPAQSWSAPLKNHSAEDSTPRPRLASDFPQIISPSREPPRATAPPPVAKTVEVENSSRPEPAALRAANVPEVPTSPAQTTSDDLPTGETPGDDQPLLSKDSVPPSTHAVAPIDPVPRLGSQTVQGVPQTSMNSAWMSLEEAIGSYEHLLHEGRPDRGAIISTVLLPFLRSEEQQGRTNLSKRLAKRQRDVLFSWVELITSELKRTQPAHRGALLEAVATILESHNLSIASLGDDEADQKRFRSAVVHILDFAIEKLNDKAVYANTLVFSGRILALAFFRIDGVALKLIRALPPVKRLTLRRVLQEAGANENALPAVDRDCYPPHLLPLCLTNFRDYAAQVSTPQTRQSEDSQILVHDGDVHLQMSGNWLIRWTASDSDLPFSFYRAYFRQLSSLLVPFELRGATAGEACLPAAHVITAPGFLFVAASLLDKSDALVHRNLRSVTSIGHSSGNFNTNDSANLAFGQKPKVLELAQRRVTTTMLDVVGGPRAGNNGAMEAAPDAAARRYLFGTMLQVWIRATVKRTSMWDQRGVFLLLDLIEGLIYTLAYPVAPMGDSVEDDDSAARPDERSLDLLDIGFIFDFVRRILSEADNTVTIMRTIAFVYAHFEILTLRPHDRTELCESLLLDEALFQRLFLHWNSGCRGFFIRLLVWRVSRLGAIARDASAPPTPDQSIVSIFNLLNVRLEAVRKRHEQLEPADNLSTDEAFFRPKRSTICSTRGVKEAPWALYETGDEAGPGSEVKLPTVQPRVPNVDVKSNNTERLQEEKASPENAKPDQNAVSKVVSWLKGGRSKKSGRADRPKPIAVPPVRSSTAAQEWSTAPLPTKVETGDVITQREQPPPSRSTSGNASPGLTRQGSSASTSSNREKRRSRGSAFFAFEFENGVVSRADVDPNLLSPGEPAAGATSPPPASDASSPTRPRSADRASALSPRVSVRFSKRSSILPPAALDLLKSTGMDEVPPIPERFRRTVETGYDRRLHPYAVRGLRDYEDALDEWTDWVARLQEEEEQAPSAFDIVPRLAVNWPLNSEEN
ncbi:hypothetical protein B0A53_00274 [Rhodotorula sp. CCFEE 5036]|nr:hypothetical protein B0A53_00274 [Rhodotorula sp. CCFEE 5036]